MNNLSQKFTTTIFILFFSTSFLSLSSQIKKDSILSKYKNFGSSTKELVYVHINKSVFVKDEIIGFSAYVLEKSQKTPLTLTKNLYCTISNEKNEVIKSKLINVINGLAYNTFTVDSVFNTGVYKFRAYTNWMLNFKERNHYEHSFFVINPNTKKEEKTGLDKEYKIQVLPESGHLVAGIKNNVGIVVKDKNGVGLNNGSGKIVNSKNEIITEFSLNQFGIAKIPFIPIYTENYRIIVNYKNKEIASTIRNIEYKGIILSISNLRDKLGFSLKTNDKTKEIIKGKKYFLAIHNGSDMKTIPFQFDDKVTEVSKIIRKKELYTGMNIFTVFDTELNKPILERLFFNSIGISNQKINNVITSIENDSITIKLKIKEAIDIEKIQNISVSVLPNKTKSYNFNSTILSQLYLEPYVRGSIQNASYYFFNNSPKTSYDLDNLLITQGWSSYDWKDIFKKPNYSNKFEQGIDIIVNVNNKKNDNFLIHPLKNHKTKIITLNEKEKAFTQSNIFPENDETYKVSFAQKKSISEKPNLYIQFYPNKIPDFTIESYSNNYINSLKLEDLDNFDLSFKNFGGTEMLNEIVLKTKIDAARQKKIRRVNRGSIEFFDDKNTSPGLTLANYLAYKGFIVNDYLGRLSIINPNPTTLSGNATPLVILDNLELANFDILSRFQMDIVDYIVIDKKGLDYGSRAGAGVIKIVTDPLKRIKPKSTYKDNVSINNFPLTFSSPKKYYAPIYDDYTSKSFKEYGTLSWFPNLKVDENGMITFKILNTFTPLIDLYIEGVLNGKTFISDKKTINP